MWFPIISNQNDIKKYKNTIGSLFLIGLAVLWHFRWMHGLVCRHGPHRGLVVPQTRKLPTIVPTHRRLGKAWICAWKISLWHMHNDESHNLCTHIDGHCSLSCLSEVQAYRRCKHEFDSHLLTLLESKWPMSLSQLQVRLPIVKNHFPSHHTCTSVHNTYIT